MGKGHMQSPWPGKRMGQGRNTTLDKFRSHGMGENGGHGGRREQNY